MLSSYGDGNILSEEKDSRGRLTRKFFLENVHGRRKEEKSRHEEKFVKKKKSSLSEIGARKHPTCGYSSSHRWLKRPMCLLACRWPAGTLGDLLTAPTFKTSALPAVQDVPEAMSIGLDHWPLAQRWKELPLMQFQVPSGLQAPDSAPLLEPELLGVLDGAGTTDAVAVETGAMGEAPDAKMPGAPVGVVAGAELATGAEEALLTAAEEVAGEAPGEVPLGAALDGPGPGPPVHAGFPIAKRFSGRPASSRESPGSGKRRSTLSGVVQPLMLATNMDGKLSRLEIDFSVFSVETSRFWAPASTLIGAQFMYISRLPIRLNQVHARV